MVKDLKQQNILGIMSGTSLDGLDLALCSFSRRNNKFEYSIIKSETLTYPAETSNMLEGAINLPAKELTVLDHDFGKYIGRAALKFLEENNLKADWIASHGHTVFHQPSESFTFQAGNGSDIAATTGIPVIFDFRSMDVALGGQGAPLVPAGDEYLFGKYDYCLNLGGFSNISFKKENKRIAFDICPVNMGLNYLSNKIGMDFDLNGSCGKEGNIIPGIVNKLNKLEYYSTAPPKSLGREWFIKNMEPVLSEDYPIKDILRSLYEHIAVQVSKVLTENRGRNVLVTGGGANNSYLVELLSEKSGCNCEVPNPELVDFKEALIFAFLGYLRINNIPNVFSSVTGSLFDHCGGVIASGKS